MTYEKVEGGALSCERHYILLGETEKFTALKLPARPSGKGKLGEAIAFYGYETEERRCAGSLPCSTGILL
jgi:hypothetical protein